MTFLRKVWKCLDNARGIKNVKTYYGEDYLFIYNFCRSRRINDCELSVLKKLASIWNIPISVLIRLSKYERLGEK